MNINTSRSIGIGPQASWVSQPQIAERNRPWSIEEETVFFDLEGGSQLVCPITLEELSPSEHQILWVESGGDGVVLQGLTGRFRAYKKEAFYQYCEGLPSERHTDPITRIPLNTLRLYESRADSWPQTNAVFPRNLPRQVLRRPFHRRMRLNQRERDRLRAWHRRAATIEALGSLGVGISATMESLFTGREALACGLFVGSSIMIVAGYVTERALFRRLHLQR